MNQEGYKYAHDTVIRKRTENYTGKKNQLNKEYDDNAKVKN